MKIINFEERKINYLLNKCNLKLEEVNRVFNKIDEKMSKINIGTKLYKEGGWGDYFELNVVDIIDKENGIIAIKEPGYFQHEDEIRHEEVYYLYFKEDLY